MLHKLAVVLLLVGLALSASAVTDPAQGKPTEEITAMQLEQRLVTIQGKPDADAALMLSRLELTERLSTARLARFNAALPGDKSRQALMLVADSAAFLDLPEADVPPDPVPTVFYQPLHYVGRGSVQITYRDHREVQNDGVWKPVSEQSPMRGLVTAGEFGPFLSTVVADAIHGKITWSHWEQSTGLKQAVFHYVVAKQSSHYSVQFTSDLIPGSNAGEPSESQVIGERAAYHGEISFNPASGAILRITIVADMQPPDVITRSDMMVEYGPVEIGDRSYICPLKSVSVLQNHRPRSASQLNPNGSLKTYLNDVTFAHYRRFGSEVNILGEGGKTAAP